MFNVKVALIITCMLRDKPLLVGVCTNNNKLPEVDISNGQSTDQEANSLFLRITGLSPIWAGLKFSHFHVQQDQIVFYYKTVLSPLDRFIDGYIWTTGIDKIDMNNPRQYITLWREDA